MIFQIPALPFSCGVVFESCINSFFFGVCVFKGALPKFPDGGTAHTGFGRGVFPRFFRGREFVKRLGIRGGGGDMIFRIPKGDERPAKTLTSVSY